MTTNPHINLYNANNEQQLVDNLIIESIKFYGIDMYYIVRTGEEVPIFKEKPQSFFNTAFPIEMYIKSVDGYMGDGMFLSNFGIEIRHQAIFTVSITRWTQENTTQTEPLVRPREGDLIYFAIDNKMMEIKKVNQYSFFYQMGALQCYDLVCEVFEYSSEEFNTGIEAIDKIQDLSISTNSHDSTDDDIPNFDPGFGIDRTRTGDNEDIGVRTDEQDDGLIDFREDDPFAEKW